MRVFLTGGSGALGLHVVKRLVARGDVVSGLARSPASADKLTKAGATPVSGEHTDTALLKREAAKADAVRGAASLDALLLTASHAGLPLCQSRTRILREDVLTREQAFDHTMLMSGVRHCLTASLNPRSTHTARRRGLRDRPRGHHRARRRPQGRQRPRQGLCLFVGHFRCVSRLCLTTGGADDPPQAMTARPRRPTRSPTRACRAANPRR